MLFEDEWTHDQENTKQLIQDKVLSVTSSKVPLNLESPTFVISDNRFSSGKEFEDVGFRFHHIISPQYYWWKNKRRVLESNLQKDTEQDSESRKSSGYKRIWDLGKICWIFSPPV